MQSVAIILITLPLFLLNKRIVLYRLPAMNYITFTFCIRQQVLADLFK